MAETCSLTENKSFELLGRSDENDA